MPYPTSDDITTSLKIAIRNNIAVKIIQGYPFIKSTKRSVNVANNVAESKELDAIFKMEAKTLVKALPCHIPDHSRAEKTILTVNYFCNTL
eukprot:1555630-Ditylum_brightwellii.AAC.1